MLFLEIRYRQSMLSVHPDHSGKPITVKLDFLILGSSTRAFFSQIAFFKLCLDAIGGVYVNAVACGTHLAQLAKCALSFTNSIAHDLEIFPESAP